MLRTQISLSERERALLDAEAARTGRSISALIRAAVMSVYGRSHAVDDDLAALRAAFGAWDRDALDGEAWVEQRRSGARLHGASDRV